MKNQTNFQKLLNERTSITRSITAILLLLVAISTYGQAVIIKRNMNLDRTNYLVADWDASLIGFRTTAGDINESGVGPIIRARMIDDGGYWKPSADFRSHNVNEIWYVDVMFTRKGLAEISGITPATSGNVGIGTTEPTEKLHVNGFGKFNNGLKLGSNFTGALPSELSASNTVGVLLGAGNDNAFFGLVNRNGESGSSNEYNTVLYFGDDVADDLTFKNQDNGELMRLTGNGNLGIGTDSPKQKLHVNGDIYARGHVWLHALEGDGETGIAYLQARDNSGTSDLGLQLRSQSGGNIVNAIKINPNGNVGIGTTEPSEKLHVNGNAFVNGDASVDGNASVDGEVSATSFVTSAASFPDYVFKEGYDLMPLNEMETFVQANHHLPNMPSEAEVVSQGMNLNTIVTQSVENIEAIYLHLIRLEKELNQLKEENRQLKAAQDAHK